MYLMEDLSTGSGLNRPIYSNVPPAFMSPPPKDFLLHIREGHHADFVQKWMDNQDSDDTWLKLLNDNDIFYEQNFLYDFFLFDF